LGGFRLRYRVGDHLGQPEALAQIKECDPAALTLAVDKASQDNRLSEVGGAQFTASV